MSRSSHLVVAILYYLGLALPNFFLLLVTLCTTLVQFTEDDWWMSALIVSGATCGTLRMYQILHDDKYSDGIDRSLLITQSIYTFLFPFMYLPAILMPERSLWGTQTCFYTAYVVQALIMGALILCTSWQWQGSRATKSLRFATSSA